MVKYFEDCFVVVELKVEVIGLFVGQNFFFVEFYGLGDDVVDFEVVDVVLVDKVIVCENCDGVGVVGQGVEGFLRSVFGFFVVIFGVRVGRDFVLCLVVYLIVEIIGYVMWVNGFGGDFVQLFGFDVVGVFVLVVLEVVGVQFVLGVGGVLDEGGVESFLGLVDFGVGDLVDEVFVVFQGFGWLGDFYVQCVVGGDGFEIF